MASASSGSSVTTKTTQLLYAREKLLLLPSSNAELLNVLSQVEKILSDVQQSPSESMKKTLNLNPITEAIFAKGLTRHADINVKISVACCIGEIMRIMAPENPHNDDQMKDFFEMVVVTFEKLSSTHGGCYINMTSVLKKFSSIRLWVLMLDLELDGYGLIVRLFKQFLTFADFNSSAIVLEMEKTMTMIILESEELAPKLLSFINTIVKNDNRISSPVCWQLGEKVLMNYAAHLKPDLPEMEQDMSIALYDYSKMVARIRDTALNNEIMEAKEAIPCTINKCQDLNRRAVKLLDVNSKDNKKHGNKFHRLLDDPPKCLTKLKGKRKDCNSPWRKQVNSVEHGESLVGSRIKVWWPADSKYYSGVVECFDSKNKRHKVLYDDGDEELLNLKHERWKLFDYRAHASTSVISVRGYNVKPSVAPILDWIFSKHGDIAAKCVFTTHSMRASLLEFVCEIVKQTVTDEVVEKMEEIESQVSCAEAVKIDVSWLRAHLEALRESNGLKR